MLKSIKIMLQSLEEEGIVYCHWKSNEHLAAALEGDTDLDVLFDFEQRSKLDVVLNKCGLKRFLTVSKMHYNGIEDYIGFDEETAKIWHLHTHHRMTLGEKNLKGYTITPWVKELLTHRRKDKLGIWCSDYADELVLLCVRMAMKLRLRDCFKNVSKGDLREYNWAKQHTKRDNVVTSSQRLLSEEGSNEIVRLFDNGFEKKGDLRRLHRILLNDLRCFTGNTRLQSNWKRHKRELFWLIGGIHRRLSVNQETPTRRFSPSGGLAVSIIGCDGAGKSTTLKYIYKEFKKKIDVAVVYFGSGDGSSSLLRLPMRIVAKRVNKSKGASKQSTNHKDKKKGVLGRFAKILWAIALASEKKSKLRKMTTMRNNGLLVLTDRYPQTAFPGINDGPLLSDYKHGLMGYISRWEWRIYEMANKNKPDLAIKLMVPSEMALTRKPDMSLEKIEEKRRIVTALDIAETTIEVDTTKPFEVTRSEAMKAIWERI